MKKTLNMMLAMMAGAMAFTACSSDDILENIENSEVAEAPSLLKPMTFSAVQEGQGTRAAIDGLKINWTAGDKISIFDGATENGGVQMFELATGENTTSATFTGSAAEANTYYALYPYAAGEISRQVTQADAEAAAGSIASRDLGQWKVYIGTYMEYKIQEDMANYGISAENQAIIYAFLRGQNITVAPGLALDGSSIKDVVIPAEQTATAGSADPQAMVMVAKGDDKEALQFKNVCAYVKVTPQFDCYAIALISKGSENLAGKVTVDCSGETPTTTVTEDGTNAVYLVGTITANNAYYIAVRPEALTSGFTIEFLTADKNTYYARSTSKTLALARSNVKNLGEFATSGTWTITSPTTGNDGNGHSWQLITPNLKMATSIAAKNVTFANIPDWGTNWVLPTADDFNDLWQKGGIYVNGNAKLHGVGILKYLSDVNLVDGNAGYYWTSTPDGEKQKGFNLDASVPIISRDKSRTGLALFKMTVESGLAKSGTAKATIGGSEVDVKWVQLWAGGPKFAEYNVGVTDGKAESYGGYYCWGKSTDKDPNKVYREGSDVLSSTDDTATNLWGSAWRMPTKAELDALLANCDVVWTTVNDVNGRKFTGKGDYASNSVFLPAAGYYYGNVLLQGSKGYYWSSTVLSTGLAYYLRFESGDQGMDNCFRNYGYSIRAVLAE